MTDKKDLAPEKVLSLVTQAPDEDLIAFVQELLEGVKSGEVTAVLSLLQYKGGEFEPVLVGDCKNIATAVGELRFLEDDLIKRGREDDG